MPESWTLAPLEDIRERSTHIYETSDVCESQEDVTPLLAALDAVLARHWPEKGDWATTCGGCWGRHGSHPLWPCPDVLAITNALHRAALRAAPGEGNVSCRK